MKYPYGWVQFVSNLGLDGVCDLLSREVFGSTPFRVSHDTDEVPCRALSGRVLGFRVRVFGYGGDKGYEMAVEPQLKPGPSGDYFDHERLCVSEYLYDLLRDLPDVTAFPPGPCPQETRRVDVKLLRKAAAESAEVLRRARESGTESDS